MSPEHSPSAREDPFKYRLRFLILSLLAIKPSHGYELSRRIEEITQGFIRAGPGSVYPTLRELREEGLIEETTLIESGRVRKVYKLTRKGAMDLLNSLDIFQDIAASLLELTAEARRSLAARIREEQADCVPRQIVERLEALTRMIEEYLTLLKEKKQC